MNFVIEFLYDIEINLTSDDIPINVDYHCYYQYQNFQYHCYLGLILKLFAIIKKELHFSHVSLASRMSSLLGELH